MTLDQLSGFPSDDRPDEAFANVDSFGPSSPQVDGYSVTGDYILYYMGSQPVTVSDYMDSTSAAGLPQMVYAGMPWTEFYGKVDDATYQLQSALFKAGVTDQAPYDYEQWQRDAANLAEFDDSRDLAMTGFVNPFVSGGGGRRGGGGRSGPTYVAPNYQVPDRAALREQIKAYVVAVTGKAHDSLIDAATDTYLEANREAFDAAVSADRTRTLSGTPSDVAQIDPWQRAVQHVRDTALYKTIHGLRPDSVDEMEWVTSRQAKLEQLGLSAQRASTLGVKQAQAGSTDRGLVGAAERQYNTDRGLILTSQRNKIKNAAVGALRLV